MSQQHWEAFYREGTLISCPTNPEPYYAGEVREAWVRFFAALDNGARILDIGTGNGPIALIAKETADANGRNFSIDGVDLAEIDPHRDVPDGARLLEGVRFHPGVSTEDLPFEDGLFDAISGQYIVEYTDAEKTLEECFRVLAPGGRCQLMLHHSDSIVVQFGFETLRQADAVQIDTRIVQRFRRFCERSMGAQQGAESAYRQLATGVEQLEQQAAVSANPVFLKFVIESLGQLMQDQTRLGRGRALKQSMQLERNIGHWVQRVKDLVSAAQSDDDIQKLTSFCDRIGFDEIETALQYQYGDKLIGWRINLHKPH
jgi:ubiquinone/menaquinone biosynthesis C-methylase UbiE